MITYQTALHNVDKILELEPPEQAQEKEQPKPELWRKSATLFQPGQHSFLYFDITHGTSS